jgi:D-sedoheptulose 7-phosphate isomerase
MKDIVQREFNEHLKSANLLHNLTQILISSAIECINCLNNGGKILIFGNGGSAADAQHIAAELVGRYRTERIGLKAIALTTDTSVITSIANDYGFEYVFSRQIEALANKGDVVIGISTSGNSKNVINAIKLASKLECKTIGFTGRDGGEMTGICDINLIAPSEDTPRIQEMHIILGHTLCQLIDNEFKV